MGLGGLGWFGVVRRVWVWGGLRCLGRGEGDWASLGFARHMQALDWDFGTIGCLSLWPFLPASF